MKPCECSFAFPGQVSRGRSPAAALTAHCAVIHSRSVQVSCKIQKPGQKTRFCWCGRRDLNPYGSPHTPLKRARMPIPPRPHASQLFYYTCFNVSCQLLFFALNLVKIFPFLAGEYGCFVETYNQRNMRDAQHRSMHY